MTDPAAPTRMQPRWFHPRLLIRSVWLRPRVLAGMIAGLTTLVVLPQNLAASARDAIAWDVGGLVYLSLAARLMLKVNADTIKARAARSDESGYVILAMVVIAMMASFAAIAGLASEAKTATANVKSCYFALAATTLFISWSVIQVVFTIHYAHVHYGSFSLTGTAQQALKFPGDDKPNYWDFLYFATSIGATSQTSDVAIHTKQMRHLVTAHAVISFIFNTMVLAVTINIAASLI
jgi:uncharacterized membrane protein